MEYAAVYDTTIGPLGIRASEDAVTAVCFGGIPPRGTPHSGETENALCREAAREIAAYLRRERKTFDIPVKFAGTAFQNAVWTALRAIPWGETRTYAQIGAALGKQNAARAVGGACHRNPVPLIIPCHRVIGADGGLTGFAGGVGLKETLLSLEHP